MNFTYLLTLKTNSPFVSYSSSFVLTHYTTLPAPAYVALMGVYEASSSFVNLSVLYSLFTPFYSLSLLLSFEPNIMSKRIGT